MKVIFLTGPSKSGKTTTLHELYNTLMSNGGTNIIVPQVYLPGAGDAIYYIKYNDRKIGIVTLGDYAVETVFQIGVFLGRGADILVIANSNKEYPKKIFNYHSDKRYGLLEQLEVKKYSIQDHGKIQEITSMF